MALQQEAIHVWVIGLLAGIIIAGGAAVLAVKGYLERPVQRDRPNAGLANRMGYKTTPQSHMMGH